MSRGSPPPDPAARLTAERTATAGRVTALAAQVAALAEQQALTTHDDEHDPEGVTIGFERAQLLGLLAGSRTRPAARCRPGARRRAWLRLTDARHGRQPSAVRCDPTLP